MAQFTLYIDTYRNKLISGLNNSTIVDPSSLPLFAGDTLSLNVYLLAPLQIQNPSQFNYEIVSTAGLQLFVYLDDGTIEPVPENIYTQQIAWNTDPDNQYFWANVPLNTENLSDLLNSGENGGQQAQCWLKIGYIQNGLQTTVFSSRVTVMAGLPEVELVVPPGLTPLSAEVANATYWTNQPVAGRPLIFMTPKGKLIAYQPIDNDDGTGDVQIVKLN